VATRGHRGPRVAALAIAAKEVSGNWRKGLAAARPPQPLRTPRVQLGRPNRTLQTLRLSPSCRLWWLTAVRFARCGWGIVRSNDDFTFINDVTVSNIPALDTFGLLSQSRTRLARIDSIIQIAQKGIHFPLSKCPSKLPVKNHLGVNVVWHISQE